MTKTKAIRCASWLSVFIVAAGCDNVGPSPEHRPRTCDAPEVARVVGEAVVTGDPQLVRSVVMTGRDLAWLQGASETTDDADFNQRSFTSAAADISAWAARLKDGKVARVDLGRKLENHSIEGFSRRTDVIDDSSIDIEKNGTTTRIHVQHMFLVNGCWRIVEIGKPDQR